MANKKISELPEITTPTTADLVPVVQSGVTDKITRGNFLKNVDADATLTDITTNNSSTAKHGFLKKLSNSATEYMDGSGNWSTPAGGGGSGVAEDLTTAETDTTLVLAPDGAGGVEWRAETGGGGGSCASPLTNGDPDAPELIFLYGDVIMVGC